MKASNINSLFTNSVATKLQIHSPGAFVSSELLAMHAHIGNYSETASAWSLDSVLVTAQHERPGSLIDSHTLKNNVARLSNKISV